MVYVMIVVMYILVLGSAYVMINYTTQGLYRLASMNCKLNASEWFSESKSFMLVLFVMLITIAILWQV